MKRQSRTIVWARLSLIVGMLFLLFGCSQKSGAAPGLLAKLQPLHQTGVRDADRLTDGLVPPTGSGWNTNRTTVFSSRHARVDYDLGSVVSVRSAALMGDNNDTYQLLSSLDGENYQLAWTAQPVRAPGMQWRSGKIADVEARYLRLQPLRGDVSLSVAELSVFSEADAVLPPRLKQVSASDVALSFRSALLVSGMLLVLASCLAYQGASLLWLMSLLLLVAGSVAYAGYAFVEAYPLGKLEVSLVRGVSAAVALALVLRTAFGPERFKAVPWMQSLILGALALLSVGAFYNMGTPQFFDAKNNEPSVVHNFDMRVYFPVAKYFDELKYDGLYLASVVSYAEEHGGLESRQIQQVELRDLRDHRMRKVSQLGPELAEVRTRFSDSRWAEFKGDMRYFWETMGSNRYLGSMADHGGNATPAWLTIAYGMFSHAAANDTTLLWGAALDPLLLLIFAIAVWRSFGLQTALVSLIIFGANDFYMFGSNWAGATLRNDWMVYLGLGACALKSERYKVAGALLAMSALIRAFPAIALIALAIPAVQQIVLERRESGKWPEWKELLKSQRWFVQTALGASICVAATFVLSSVVLGFDAWPLWVKKISSFTASPHVNHLGWITVVAGSEGRQALVLAQRGILYNLGLFAFFGLGIWIAARSKPHQAALLGILMMPVFMYPANYYIHFVFLLPLLVSDLGQDLASYTREQSGKVWALLLALCAAQYFTVRETDLANHFYNASVLLMVTLFFVLIAMLPRDAEGRIDFERLPFIKP